MCSPRRKASFYCDFSLINVFMSYFPLIRLTSWIIFSILLICFWFAILLVYWVLLLFSVIFSKTFLKLRSWFESSCQTLHCTFFDLTIFPFLKKLAKNCKKNCGIIKFRNITGNELALEIHLELFQTNFLNSGGFFKFY